jgi:hypothetical protein
MYQMTKLRSKILQVGTTNTSSVVSTRSRLFEPDGRRTSCHLKNPEFCEIRKQSHWSWNGDIKKPRAKAMHVFSRSEISLPVAVCSQRSTDSTARQWTVGTILDDWWRAPSYDWLEHQSMRRSVFSRSESWSLHHPTIHFSPSSTTTSPVRCRRSNN